MAGEISSRLPNQLRVDAVPGRKFRRPHPWRACLRGVMTEACAHPDASNVPTASYMSAGSFVTRARAKTEMGASSARVMVRRVGATSGHREVSDSRDVPSSSMTPESAGAWIGLIGVALGALFTLLGVGISEFGQNQRARRAERDAIRARRESRRTELWDISRPAASRVQEFFAGVSRLARYDPNDDHEPNVPFEEGFPDWWYENSVDVRREIALIPSQAFRSMLLIVVDGIDVGYDLARWTEYARGYQHAVARISAVGFDIASSWLRDEPDLDLATQARFDALRGALYDSDNRSREAGKSKKPKGVR